MLRALDLGSALNGHMISEHLGHWHGASHALALEMESRQINEHLFQTGSFSLPVTPPPSLDETALGSESKFMSRDANLRQA
jgi:hypothetical protein